MHTNKSRETYREQIQRRRKGSLKSKGVTLALPVLKELNSFNRTHISKLAHPGAKDQFHIITHTLLSVMR